MSNPSDFHPSRYRDKFPILSHTNYLISNSLGAVPVATRDALLDYYETWASRGVRAWEEGWWTLAADVGNLVAPLIGAHAGEVVFLPNVTLAHAVVLSALGYQPGRDALVTDALHFPSILYLIDAQRDLGARVVTVPSDDGIGVDPDRTRDAVTPDTVAVLISHVLFKSAFIQDVAAVAERAREVGALVVVDGYQAVGAIPVDVHALGADIYIGGCLKWLCGGPGNAFLWARPDLALAPKIRGWAGHARPFDFNPRFEPRADAWRFLQGTPAIPALHAARPGLEVVNAVGIDAIRAHSTRQTTRLLDHARARGFTCRTPDDPARRGGTVALDVPHGYAVSKALKDRDILCDFRPGAGIRLSPHFYNLDDELDAALDAVDDILRNQSWRPFESTAAAVT